MWVLNEKRMDSGKLSPRMLSSIRVRIAQYRWLRDHYIQHHLQLSLPGCSLSDARGNKLGYLEEVRFHHGRVHLRGWTLARCISLRLGDLHIRRWPNEEREDVAAAMGCDRRVGFTASLPYAEGTMVIELEPSDLDPLRIRHEIRMRGARARAQLRLRLRYWRETLPLVPMIARGLLREDTDLPRRIKTALRLDDNISQTTLNPAFLARPGPGRAMAGNVGRICVIMPIYDAFELLPEALGRVLAHTDLPFRLILIEDCSSDTRVRPWLRDWVQAQDAPHRDLITLVENDENLGFIRSVNRGFDLARSEDDAVVVLLNSDAMVPAAWASRLIAPLADPEVATATPLSNDAEIFTAPVICTRTALEDGQADAIDDVLQARIAAPAPEVDAPTGVGFCMALRRDWLDRAGGFDPAFGRGYGEEVDWCRRTAAQGARHVAAPGLFVEHRGGASFGDEKLALVQKNNAVISARYPGYNRMVQDFIRDDRLVTPRLVAALAWADSLPDLEELPVYIAHSLGGGAENYLQDRVASAPVSVVLRLGGAWRCRIELATPSGRLIANTDDLDLVVRLLAPVAKRRIIYSCAVGDPDLGALPGLLLRLAADAPLDILFHDYLPISPSYTLLDGDAAYRGAPSIDHDDAAHTYRRADGSMMTLREWRASWGGAVDKAARLVVFSQASADIVATAFPQAAPRLHIRPHKLLQTVPPLVPADQGRRVIGVLGAIGPQKGAEVLSKLSDRLRGEPDIGLALIGRIAPGFPLAGTVPVHGVYAIEDIAALAARYGVTHWLIPSIWPETFSFTVHECLATGLPTLAFDLGAQGEAVRYAENGIVLPWEPGARAPDALARLVIDAVAGDSE